MKFLKTIIRRVIISSIRDIAGEIRRVDAAGLTMPDGSKEQFLDRESFQHYGITSKPVDGNAEGIFIGMGNVFYLIAEDDRRYRIAIENGEVALYTDEGDKIHLKRNRTIEITGGTKVIINSPETEVSGDLKVTGDIIGSGNVSDSTGSMATMRQQYNGHTHPGGGAPNPQMT